MREKLVIVLGVLLWSVGTGTLVHLPRHPKGWRDSGYAAGKEPTGMDLKNRFYLYGQYIGFKLNDCARDDHTLREALGASIFGDHTPEATILQAQLFLAGEAQKFQELMGLADQGTKNPLDTSSELYLDQLDQRELAQLGKFIDDHGESGFASAAARDQIVRNLKSGPLAVRAMYARFYIHRYTIGLETKEDVLAKLQELQETAIDSRTKEYWNILERIVHSNELPGRSATDGTVAR